LLWARLARERITADEAWAAAHVDEDWNMQQWGRDELALERRAYRYACCRLWRRCCNPFWHKVPSFRGAPKARARNP
jgi:chaperone required for assembly of F1-ATPase